ncbi:pyruvate/2-oxoglutarate dehydrogenase complex, dihydrolipoamide acyltransferase component [Burkholderiales bacterium JOSHI_001]|nr:pyruvate/2-oxoglutarate dehydrogenase complex, dihydrolipoamide acyltransferase component [Burkholderiales bacterium JOSHI_001]
MSLATRCPACATSFRVVQDQLKVSAGWVRCGRCGEVFNALEALFDLDTEAPGATVQENGQNVAETETVRQADDLQTASAPNAPAPQPPAAAPEPAPEVAPLPPPPPPPPPAPPPRQLPTAVNADFILPAGATLITAVPPAAAPVAAEAPAAEPGPDARELSFVRRAERAARWQRPGMRLLLSVLALLALAGLFAQNLLAQRDLAAARWPGLQPALEQACAWLGCRLQAPRRIEQLAVESSGFTRVEGSPLYRLTLVLRNKADLPLALPAVELAVTDPAGQLVSRRVLLPTELGATQAAIAPGAELPLQALLGAGERRLAGYTVEIFYP